MSEDNLPEEPDYLARLRHEWDRHAASYDLVYGASEGRRVEQERDFLQWAFAELATRPVREVLDLTAGTGLQAVELTRLGFRVTAADLSAAMLEQCRSRAATAGVELVDTICRAAQQTTERAAFDACISCFAGLNHLVDERDLLEVFTRARRALRPGGLFVFDLINVLEDALSFAAEPPVERVEERDGTRFRTQMTSRYDSWNALLHFREQTAIECPGRADQTVDVSFTYRGYTRAETVRLLGEAGFDDVRCFRGYTDRGESADDRVYRMVFAGLKGSD